jgi:outer membrane lipoprotein SlyB
MSYGTVNIRYRGPAPFVFIGGAVGGGLGAIAGYMHGGPLGAVLGSLLGALVGVLIEEIMNGSSSRYIDEVKAGSDRKIRRIEKV